MSKGGLDKLAQLRAMRERRATAAAKSAPKPMAAKPKKPNRAKARKPRAGNGTALKITEVAGTIKPGDVVTGLKRSTGRPRKGSEDATHAATKPWEKEFISERTWYRRRAMEKKL